MATPEALVKACARCATTASSSGEAPRVLLLAVLFVVSACVAMIRRPSTQFGIAQPGLVREILQWSLRLLETRRLTRSRHLCKRKLACGSPRTKPFKFLKKQSCKSHWLKVTSITWFKKQLVQKTSAQNYCSKNKWFKK
jgi:hypothetical protein